MAERKDDGRAGAATDGPAPSPRPQTPTDAGPFGGAPTKLADAASIRNLIEQSAQADDKDRKTREMDPKQFAALVRRDTRTPPKGAPIAAPVAPVAPAVPAPANLDAELDAAFADPDVAGITANEHAVLAVTVDTTAIHAELAAADAAVSPPAFAEPAAPASDAAAGPSTPTPAPMPVLTARGPSLAMIVLAILVLGAIAAAAYLLALS